MNSPQMITPWPVQRSSSQWGANITSCMENNGKHRNKGNLGKSFFFLKPEPYSIKYASVCVLVNLHDIY